MSLRIIKAGLFDSIQDEGRYGFQHLGINPGGWMDQYSAQLANALLGKSLSAQLLEMTFPAASLLFERGTIICLTGACFSPTLNGQTVPLNQPLFVPANTILEFKQHVQGQWCYLSLLHNLQLDNWLESYSTNAKIRTGGFKGRSLQKEDRILFADQLLFTAKFKSEVQILPWKESQPLHWKHEPLDIIKGAEWPWLTEESRQQIENSRFTITRQSDRMGYRLSGVSIAMNSDAQLVSSAVCAGTIQRLPNGQLIVLMADHQTTGGYPRMGYVTTSALSQLAQFRPGQSVAFQAIKLEDAHQKQVRLQKYLQGLKNACTFKMQNIAHAL